MKYVKKIVRLYFENKYPADTERKIKKWLLSEDKADEKEQALWDVWNTTFQSQNTLRLKESLNETKEKLGLHQTKNRRLPRHRMAGIAAACILAILVGVGCWIRYEHLTEKTYLTEKTAKGEKKICHLPDGSIICLNASSSLRYPISFKTKTREVYLSGEAFFSVRRDTLHPFIVHSTDFTVKVLGTKFNVCDYTDNNSVSTSLLSGKVEITNKRLNESFILTPGKELVYDKSKQQEKINEDADNIAVWQSNKLYFNKASLNDILLSLERKFNVSITNKGTANIKEKYTVKFISGENIEQILSTLHSLDRNFSWKKESKNEYSFKYAASK